MPSNCLYISNNLKTFLYTYLFNFDYLIFFINFYSTVLFCSALEISSSDLAINFVKLSLTAIKAVFIDSFSVENLFAKLLAASDDHTIPLYVDSILFKLSIALLIYFSILLLFSDSYKKALSKLLTLLFFFFTIYMFSCQFH